MYVPSQWIRPSASWWYRPRRPGHRLDEDELASGADRVRDARQVLRRCRAHTLEDADARPTGQFAEQDAGAGCYLARSRLDGS
jgi:hypothetical protein